MAKQAKESYSLMRTVREMLNDNMPLTYYLVWKYAPELLDKKCETLDDLKREYKCFQAVTDSVIPTWQYREDVQRAIKLICKRESARKDVILLNSLYDKALAGDTKAVDAYLKVKKALFADEETQNEENTLVQKIQSAKIPTNSGVEEYKEGFWE